MTSRRKGPGKPDKDKGPKSRDFFSSPFSCQGCCWYDVYEHDRASPLGNGPAGRICPNGNDTGLYAGQAGQAGQEDDSGLLCRRLFLLVHQEQRSKRRQATPRSSPSNSPEWAS